MRRRAYLCDLAMTSKSHTGCPKKPRAIRKLITYIFAKAFFYLNGKYNYILMAAGIFRSPCMVLMLPRKKADAFEPILAK